MSLKPLCFSSLSEFEGPVMDKTFKGLALGNPSSCNSVLSDFSMGDLGFVSPHKGIPTVSKGYSLQSCLKVIKDGVYGTEHDLSGTHISI